jgi:hypothetical protein
MSADDNTDLLAVVDVDVAGDVTSDVAAGTADCSVKEKKKKDEPCKFGPKCNNFHCLYTHTKEQEEIRKHLLASEHAHSKIIHYSKKIELCKQKMQEEEKKYKDALAVYVIENESKKMKHTRAKSMTRGKSKTRAIILSFDDDEDETEKQLLEELENLKERKANKEVKEVKERGRAQTRNPLG